MPLPALPSWSQTKTTSKAGFDKVYNLVDKLGAPVNRLSNKLGSEAFWPTTLDKESDKCARILRSFCKDGFYVETEEQTSSTDGKDGRPRGKAKVVKKIPTEVIRKAKGLAIFTTMRTGLWVSGAGGSGILVARTADGGWSPPSGILLHTAGLGFLVGVDIYDCVVVINTEKALEAFTKIRCTLGGEVSAVAGPVGVGGVLETELHKRQAPVWNYLKSRGFYAGVQIDGTVIIERGDENERFYGERIGVADILAGKARHPPPDIKGLMNTIKAAQGDEVDEAALPPSEPTPGDFEVQDERSGFGLPPSEDDPDPYGVHALEQEGMEVREAGTGSRPSGDAFRYSPSPSSPIFNNFSHSRNRSSGRVSIASFQTDRGTQTVDFDTAPSVTPTSPRASTGAHSPAKKTSENLSEELEDGDGEDDAASIIDPHQTSAIQTHQTQPATVISRAKLVTIPKRIPPALPPRSPYRSSLPNNSNDPAVPPNPASPLAMEYQDKGLGIDMAPHHASKPPDENLYPIPSHDTIDEKLEQIHLAPSHDTERLSPKRDGFDDISISGSSNYSHSRGVTPAEGRTPAEEVGEDTIVMEDHEAPADHGIEQESAHEGTTTTDETAHKPERPPAEPLEKQESETFHSMPGTPAEPTEQNTMSAGE